MLAAWVLAASSLTGPAVDLRWQAPAGCPDEANVRARLRAYLGEPDDAATPSAVGAVVRAQSDGTWELTLDFDGGESRRLTNATCEGLAEAAVVVVAIAVAPPGTTTPPAQKRDPEPPPRTDPPPEPVEPRRDAPAPAGRGPGRAARPIGLSLGIGGGLALGVVPLGFVLTPSVAVTRKQWRFAISGAWASRRRLRLPDLPSSGSDLVQWAVGPEACWLAPARPYLAVPLCAGVEIGEVIATPVGLANGQRRRSPWAAAVVTAALRFRLHDRVRLWFAPSAVITLTPTKVVVGGATDPLFRAAPVGLRATLGVEVQVW